MFLACFSIFTIDCIDYKTLFQNQKVINTGGPNVTNSSFVKKNSIADVVFPLSQCIERINFKSWVLLIIVITFWLFRLVKAIYNIARYYEIHSFYSSALNIQTKDLANITWHEVQEKLLQVQRKHHLCVHKQELTELDIYNRILRFKNYEVAMINQGLLPPKVDLPFVGQLILLTTGFKYNFEFLFFWGPFAPFRNCYQLRSEYKIFSKRNDLTAELSKSILILGLFNLLLMPVIFIWQLLQFAYNYSELIKRDPGLLGIRRWSNYGKLYFRHFNELDHELEARLSRAYKPAMLYLSSFVSKFLTVLAKFFLFSFGAVFAVLIVLTVYDEDVLNVEHVLTVITISGAIAGIARSLIPDENTVYFMDQMMYQILAQVHYMPDVWKLHANSYAVRDEFVKLFQYKFVYLLEELLSPIFTPFVLLFWLRPRAGKIVDFLRNFTIDVVGVGDVCSFSQMDTRRHGNPNWMSKTNTKKSFQARNGKTELSLIHFAHTNPNWKMPMESMAFMDQLKDQAIRDQSSTSGYFNNQDYTSFNQMNNQNNFTSIINGQSPNFNGPSDKDNNTSIINQENSLNKSLYHLQSLVYNSTLPSNLMSNYYLFLYLTLFQILNDYLITRIKCI
jgi:autophagy-related protein 9